MDRHRYGDDALKTHFDEPHGDQRPPALGSEALLPGVATEPVAEFGDALSHPAQREPSREGA